MHSACLTLDGKVFTWGCNDDGALGRITEQADGSNETDDVIDEYKAGQVLHEIKDLKIIQISCGDSHTCALTDDGCVYIWGTFRNVNGRIGLLKENQTERKPVRLKFKTYESESLIINKITSGNDHVCCLSSDGRLFTFGNWEQGQLGRDFDLDSDSEPTDSNETTNQMDFYLQPRAIPISNYVKFDNCWAGYYSTFARVKRTKAIYACGLNNYNQLNVQMKNYNPHDNETLLIRELTEWSSVHIPSVVDDISPSEHHTLIKSQTGGQYSLGRHDYGRLGLGTSKDAQVPQLSSFFSQLKKAIVKLSCGPATSFAITNDFKLYGWGMCDNCQIPSKKDLYEPQIFNIHNNVLDVSCGAQHVLFLLTN